jgi:methylglyoxal reductase
VRNVERRRLGDSDLELSIVGFGAWAIGGLMWGGADAREADRAIRASLDAGVNWIDTAPAYGCGRSEEIVGRAIRGRRHEVAVATKCGLRWDRTDGELRFEADDPERGVPVRIHYNLRPESLREECEASLRRLAVDVIDLYQIHWPYAPHPLEDALGELVRLREEGKLRALGVSNFGVGELEVARRCGAIASAQSPFNLTDRRVESEILPWCRAHEVGFIAYSPMARGLLTGAVTAERSFPPSDHRAHNPVFAREHRAQVAEAIERVRPIAQRKGVSPGALAVAWVLHQPGVTSALVGARNATQARENLCAATLRLTPEELAEIDGAFPRLPWTPSKPQSPARAARPAT